MKTFAWLILTLCVAPAFAQRSVLVENDWVRIPKVTVQPGHTTRFHEHAMNRVMVYLDAGGQTVEMEAGGKTEETWRAGEAVWSPAIGRHRVFVSAAKQVSIVEIELRKPGGASNANLGALDPPRADPRHYTVEMENAQVRVMRVRIPAGETAPLHHHARKRVVVYLTDADFEQITRDGKMTRAPQKAGDVVWAETEVTHAEVNRGGAFEGVVVELKE